MRPALALFFAVACTPEYGLSSFQDDAMPAPEPPEEVPEAPAEAPEAPPAEEPPPPPEPEDPPPEDDCDHTSDLIYVIDRDDETLYLFDPTTGSFDALGVLDCGPFAGSPASMSVNRDGFAYVRYSDQTLYEIDLTTMSCEETTYAANFGPFGMGFATQNATTWRDDLYVANATHLAALDTQTWTLTPRGTLPSQSELTGNAAGELWAFLPLDSPARLVRLNKNTAAVRESIPLPGFPHALDIDTFAFATWGGDFFLFVRTYGMGESTNVYRVAPDGTASVAASDTGMNIVGAGVSTCAPS